MISLNNYSLKALNRRKPLADSLAQEANTPQNLGWWDLTAFGVASTIGSGIYVTCGLVARDVTGPSVVFSTLLAGFISLLTGICYLEFASALPISGSGYAYLYTLIGEFAAWMIGWNLTLEYAFSAAAIAGGWTNYLVSLGEALGLAIPSAVYDVPVWGIVRINLLSALVVMVIGSTALGGLHFGAKLTGAVTLFNLGLIVFIIGVGGWYVSPKNWSPFMPLGLGSVVAGGGEMFFSFLGFDAITTLAADARNPARDIPLATIIVIGLGTVLYMAVGLVLTGMLPYTELDDENPLARAFSAVGCSWAYYVVTLCALTTMTVTIFTTIIGQPKIFMAMSRDGLLPAQMSHVTRKQVPLTSLIVTILLTAVLALTLDVRRGLIDMISFGCLACLSFICAATVANRFMRLSLATPGEAASAPVEKNVQAADGRVIDPNHRATTHHSAAQAANLTPSSLKMLKQLGVTSVSVLFFGSLLTAGLYNKLLGSSSPSFSSYAYCIVGITGLATVVFPSSVLSFLFVKHRRLLSRSRLAKGFECPGMPILPAVAIVINSVVMMKTSMVDIAMFLGWCFMGALVYFCYGIHHSKAGTLTAVSAEARDDAKAGEEGLEEKNHEVREDEETIPMLSKGE